ncbi:MAG: MFS transporter [Thermoplasmata archaeon]|nr:MFS transporter [Thermoplasmata archaeon]
MERELVTSPNRLVARPWLLAFVPINAATSGFGVALPLLILIPLHGAWTDVALAAGLFNGTVILSSVGWGWFADHYPFRRNLLLLNFAGFGVIYLLLANVHSIPILLGLYALVGVIAPAGTSASNLLVLEKFSSWERPTAFASFQLMGIIGSVAGLISGYLWLEANLSLAPLLYVLAGLALASVVAVWRGVRDAPRALTTSHVARHPEGLLSRIRHLPAWNREIPFFPKRPQLSREGWRRFRQWVRAEATHELPLILAASFLFNLTANLFNISYTPYLYSIGIGAASIFLVNLANNVAQGFVLPASGRWSRRSGADALVRRASYARSVGYLAVAGFTLIPLTVRVAFSANVVAFALCGGAIAFYSTASSIILFRSLEGRDAGTLLGVNSALGGIAAIAGAALSGILSIYGSYRLTFLVAAAGLLVSLPIWAAAQVAYRKRRPSDEEEPPTNPSVAPSVAAPARHAAQTD